MNAVSTHTSVTVLLVPGLRDATPEHWQTLLEAQLREQGRPVASVQPMGREAINCAERVAAIEAAAQAVDGPLVLVAHSAGCIMAAHWAHRTQCVVQGVLLAAPPDFERPMPEGYPTLEDLQEAGWLPVPRQRLPFRSIVAASRNDPLASYERCAELAENWGSELVDLGTVGHLNPASGYGPWPPALDFIEQLSAQG